MRSFNGRLSAFLPIRSANVSRLEPTWRWSAARFPTRTLDREWGDAPLSVERPPRPRPALTTRRGPANRPAPRSVAKADLLKQCLATTVLRSGWTPSGQVSEINRSDQLDSFNVTWQVRLGLVKVLQSITKHTNPLTSGSHLWLALALRFECV